MKIIFLFFVIISYLICEIKSSKRNDNNIETNVLDNLFYDDSYILRQIQQNKFKDKLLNLKSIVRKVPQIKNLFEYLQENTQYFREMNKFYVLESGRCMKVVDLKKLYSQQNITGQVNYHRVSENLENLKLILNDKNFIFNDEFGNMIIYSVCTDFFNFKCYSKFIFVSKLDFKFYEFTQSGEKIIKLTGFAIDTFFDLGDSNTNTDTNDDYNSNTITNMILYIYGGVDNRGGHNKDLFKLDIDFKFGNVNVIKLNPNEQSIIPDAVANSSLNVLRYTKQNKFNSNTNSHLIISYGGSTDETFSNKLYIFKPDEHKWSEVLKLNEGRKGHSAVLISLQNFANKISKPDEIYLNTNGYGIGNVNGIRNGNGNYTISNNPTQIYYLIIFGGKTDSDYQNDIVIIQIDYVKLEDSFTYKQISEFDVNGDIPSAREGHRAFIKDNFVYIIGGCNHRIKKCFNNEIYKLEISSVNSIKNGRLSLKWEKIFINFQQKQKFDEKNLNVQNFMGHFINFGFCEDSFNCDNSPQLLLNNINCICENAKFLTTDEDLNPKFHFNQYNPTLTCKKNEDVKIIKNEIKKIEREIENKFYNDLKNVINKGVNFTNKMDEIESEFFKKLAPNTKNDDIINMTTVNINNQTNNLKNNVNRTKVKLTANETMIIKNITHNNDTIQQQFHKKEKYHSKFDKKNHKSKNAKYYKHIKKEEKVRKIIIDEIINEHLNNLKKSEKNSQKNQHENKTSNLEMENILQEVTKQIKSSFDPFIHEYELMTNSLRKGILNQEKNYSNNVKYSGIVNFLDVRENIKREDLKNNLDYFEDISHNVSDIKDYLNEIQKKSKSSSEMKNYLQKLLQDIEDVNANNKKKMEIFEKFRKNEEILNKKVDDINKIKCVHGYLVRENKKTFCNCSPGYTGVNCDIYDMCENDCHSKGICKFGKCYCNPGFSGKSCEKTDTCLNNCFNRGNCQYGKCFCDYGFTGVDCGEKLKCENDCNNRGICYREKCLCEPGYTGKDCSIISFKFNPCPENCNGNGICKLEKCFCYPGYSGPSCQIKNEFACPPFINNNIKINNMTNFSKFNNKNMSPCNGNGICEYGLCFCNKGFKGEDCSIKEERHQINLEKHKNLLKEIHSNKTQILSDSKLNGLVPCYMLPHPNSTDQSIKNIKVFKQMKFKEIETNINVTQKSKEFEHSSIIDEKMNFSNNLVILDDFDQRMIYSGIILVSIIVVVVITFIFNRKLFKI